jgi:hypothetical protein
MNKRRRAGGAIGLALAAGMLLVTAVTAAAADGTPAAPVITSSPASPSDSRTPQWSFTIPPGTSAFCKLYFRQPGGRAEIFPSAPCSSPVAYDLTDQPDGMFAFVVQAVDAVSATSAETSSEYYTLNTAGVNQPQPPAPPPAPAPVAPAPVAPAPVQPAPAGPATLVPPTGSAARPGTSHNPSTGAPVTASSDASKAPTSAPSASGLEPRAHGVLPANSGSIGTAAAEVSNIAGALGRNAPAVATRASFPLLLLVLVVIFLLIQDRIDRKDPKLALAPVYPEPDLPFES